MADKSDGLKVTHAGGIEPHKTMITTKAPEPGAPANVGTIEQRRAPPSGPAAGQAAPRTVAVPPEGGRVAVLEAAHQAMKTAHDELAGAFRGLADTVVGLHARIADLELRAFGQTKPPPDEPPADGTSEAPAAKPGKR